MHSIPVKPSVTKLSMAYPYVQGKVIGYFLPKKIDPPPAKGRTMFLTNEIAAFGGMGELLTALYYKTNDKSL
jgi:hypothetical protein